MTGCGSLKGALARPVGGSVPPSPAVIRSLSIHPQVLDRRLSLDRTGKVDQCKVKRRDVAVPTDQRCFMKFLTRSTQPTAHHVSDCSMHPRWPLLAHARVPAQVPTMVILPNALVVDHVGSRTCSCVSWDGPKVSARRVSLDVRRAPLRTMSLTARTWWSSVIESWSFSIREVILNFHRPIPRVYGGLFLRPGETGLHRDHSTVGSDGWMNHCSGMVRWFGGFNFWFSSAPPLLPYLNLIKLR